MAGARKLKLVTLAAFYLYQVLLIFRCHYSSLTKQPLNYALSVRPPPPSTSLLLRLGRFKAPPPFSHIIPCRPLQLCCPSVLSPRTQIKMAPSFLHRIQGVYMRALLVEEGRGGFFVIKLTCVVLTKQMSQAGLRPGSTVCVTHSFVMHWPVRVLLPKRCPGSRPDSLLIHSAVLREKHRHKMAATATALSFE